MNDASRNSGRILDSMRPIAPRLSLSRNEKDVVR
jgi:hypothetical protein